MLQSSEENIIGDLFGINKGNKEEKKEDKLDTTDNTFDIEQISLSQDDDTLESIINQRVPLNTVDDAINQSHILSDILNKHIKTTIPLTFLRNLLQKICPNMKLDDVNEQDRTITVIKNELNRQQKNIKKKGKKPQLKSQGSVYDDYTDMYNGDDYL